MSIRNKNMTIDAACSTHTSTLVDQSGSTANVNCISGGNRDLIIEKIYLLIVEAVATAGVFNAGYAAPSADADAYIDAFAVPISSAGAVVEITGTPFRVPAGKLLTVGHEQVAAAGTWYPVICYHIADGSTAKATN